MSGTTHEGRQWSWKARRAAAQSRYEWLPEAPGRGGCGLGKEEDAEGRPVAGDSGGEIKTQIGGKSPGRSRGSLRSKTSSAASTGRLFQETRYLEVKFVWCTR
jgi:hypothetical protein